MRKKTHEEFLEEVKRKNVHVKIIGEYVKDNAKIECECVYCHQRYYASPSNILQGKKCYKCAKRMVSNNKAKTHEQFVEEMAKINPNILVMGKYIRAKTPVECECAIHNRRFSSTPTHLLGGETGCADCIAYKETVLRRKSNDQFLNELADVNPNIIPLEPYNGSQNKISVCCRKCGYVWTAAPDTLLSGYGCRMCYESKGEKAIEKYLSKNDIPHERQMKFPESLRGVGGLPLSYDFYVPEYNLLIEYQGEFHEKGKAKCLQTDDAFNIQHEHDIRKRNYAERNNFNFLEIWYKDKDRIDEIMSREINKYKNPVTTTA